MKKSEVIRYRILGAAQRQGISSTRALAKAINVPYSTLSRHLARPLDLSLDELQRIARVTKMPDEDILKIARG